MNPFQTVIIDDPDSGGSEAGAWASVLPFCLNVKILPSVHNKPVIDEDERHNNGR